MSIKRISKANIWPSQRRAVESRNNEEFKRNDDDMQFNFSAIFFELIHWQFFLNRNVESFGRRRKKMSSLFHWAMQTTFFFRFRVYINKMLDVAKSALKRFRFLYVIKSRMCRLECDSWCVVCVCARIPFIKVTLTIIMKRANLISSICCVAVTSTSTQNQKLDVFTHISSAKYRRAKKTAKRTHTHNDWRTLAHSVIVINKHAEQTKTKLNPQFISA